jgi:hypothetical protein
MADPTSPYDSYDDAVNADRDAEGQSTAWTKTPKLVRMRP